MHRNFIIPGLEIEFNQVEKPFLAGKYHGIIRGEFDLITAAQDGVLIDLIPDSSTPPRTGMILKFALHSSFYIHDKRLDFINGTRLCEVVSQSLCSHRLLKNSRLVMAFYPEAGLYPYGGVAHETKQGRRILFLAK